MSMWTRFSSGGGGGGGGATEISYDQIVNNVSLSDTGWHTVITVGPHTFDGTAVDLEVYCPTYGISSSGGSIAAFFWSLYEGVTQLGITEAALPSASTPSYGSGVVLRKRFTPTAGAHTYLIKASQNGAGGIVVANDGVGGNALPTFCRITKVA